MRMGGYHREIRQIERVVAEHTHIDIAVLPNIGTIPIAALREVPYVLGRERRVRRHRVLDGSHGTVAPLLLRLARRLGPSGEHPLPVSSRSCQHSHRHPSRVRAQPSA